MKLRLGFLKRHQHQEQTNSKPRIKKNSHFLARNVAPLLSLAAIGCAPRTTEATRRVDGPLKPVLMAEVLLPRRDCRVEIKNNGAGATLIYEKDGKKLKLALDIPGGFKVSTVIAISCQDERTIVVTPQYVIETFGYADLLGNKQVLNFSRRPYNAAFLILSRLGNVGHATTASIFGSSVTITTDNGKLINIDVDKNENNVKILPK